MPEVKIKPIPAPVPVPVPVPVRERQQEQPRQLPNGEEIDWRSITRRDIPRRWGSK